MRIVFYASYPDQTIGYSKVAHVLVNFLANQPDVELIYYGTGNYPDTKRVDRFLDPRIRMVDLLAEDVARGFQDPFGVNSIVELLERDAPDIFFIYNDIIVTCRVFNALLEYRAPHPSCKMYSYLDLVYPYERADYIRHVDRNTERIYVFSECWRQNLISMGVPPEKLRVFPHGFNESSCIAVSRSLARSFLDLPEDAFIVLNLNRNTYRKAQDITIAAFLQFLKRNDMNPKILLFLHCEMHSNSGYKIDSTIETECQRLGLDYIQVSSRHVLRFQESHVSDAQINYLMNAADIGLNTCMGEGFGLCNMEHAGLNKPQIVSRVGALADIFCEGDSISIAPKVTIRVPTPLDDHSGDISICDAADFAEALHEYYHNAERRERDGLRVGNRIRTTYKWLTILEDFWKEI
jgi:glycosyltransferase involved in cell wall biosynthesis